MDLTVGGSESIPVKGEVEQDTEIPEMKSPPEGIKVEINGDVSHEAQLETGIPTGTAGSEGIGEDADGSAPAPAKMNGDATRAEKTNGSPTELVGSPADVVSEAAIPTSPPTKGYGLKRWKRIRRDVSTDGGAGVDSSRILKRGLSIAETAKIRPENKAKSDGDGESSVASVDLRNSETVFHSPDPATIRGSDPELELFMAAGGFSVGTDSENSEDRSSKSSTAASAPKPKHEGVGFGRERNQVKILGGKGSGHVVQIRNQRGKGIGVDVSKKLREDHVKLEKENSRSSVESDLRSSNVQWGITVSNGRQIESCLNYDGENSDEAPMSEEVQGGFFKETGGEIEDTSRENADVPRDDKREESENFRSNVDGDPFAESILLLQAAQEALENEIQKFGELAKEPISLSYYSSGQFNYDEAECSSSPPLEAKVIELSQKVEHLERALEEASISVKAKESRVRELEAVIDGNQLPKREQKDTELLQEQLKEMYLELESLFRKKIETEIEYLILTTSTQKYKVTLSDQLALLEEQKCLAEDYEEMNIKLKDAESKALTLKRQADELESSCKELLGTEGVLKLQTRVCKLSLCCFIQSMMLFIAFGLFLMSLLPPTSDIVPT